MVVAAMQGTVQHIRSSLGFGNLPKVTLKQQPSDNKALALPLSHSSQNLWLLYANRTDQHTEHEHWLL